MKITNRKGQLKIQVLKAQKTFSFLAPENLKNFLGNQRFLVPEFSKKSQLKIQEMSFMLVAVFLFFILVGLFAFSLFYSDLQKEAEIISGEKTLSSIVNLADSPEFSCGKINCIDGDKLMSLVGKDSYENFWPFTSLKVIRETAFSKSENEMIECNMGNYPDCDIFIVYDKKILEDTRESYVAFCRKEKEEGNVYDKCEIAKFIAGSKAGE